MARRPEDVVREWSAALSRGRDEGIAATRELWHPDGEHQPVKAFPEPEPSRSREELERWIERFFEGFLRMEWDVRDVVTVDDERLLMHVVMRAEGRGSAMVLEGDVYGCFWVRDGRIARLEDHLTLRGALRAFGLEGETLEEAGLRPGSGPRP